VLVGHSPGRQNLPGNKPTGIWQGPYVERWQASWLNKLLFAFSFLLDVLLRYIILTDYVNLIYVRGPVNKEVEPRLKDEPSAGQFLPFREGGGREGRVCAVKVTTWVNTLLENHVHAWLSEISTRGHNQKWTFVKQISNVQLSTHINLAADVHAWALPRSKCGHFFRRPFMDPKKNPNHFLLRKNHWHWRDFNSSLLHGSSAPSQLDHGGQLWFHKVYN
jgi:hypothetical protein